MSLVVDEQEHEAIEVSNVPTSVPPFSVTEVRFTYNRTIQVAQYSPVNPLATVVVQVNDQGAIDDALAYARDVARRHVREELAQVAPAIIKTMDEQFIDKWLASAPVEQIELLAAYFAKQPATQPDVTADVDFWK
jgi:hypothetical protein